MKMSNTELAGLQSQLRKEIQSHQITVMKIKNDPQNPELQRLLHDHQAKIRALSDKQKKVVQQLRKELGVKKEDNGALPTHTQRPFGDAIISRSSIIPSAPSAIVSPTVKSPVPLIVDKTKQDVPKLIPSPPGQGRLTIMGSKSPSSKQLSISAPLKVPQLNRVLGHSNRTPTLLSQGSRGVYASILGKRSALSHRHSTDRRSPIDNMTKTESIVSRTAVKPGEGKKVEFMASLGLITPQTLEEIQSKRTERKRRSTANPQFSNYGQYEPDRKRHVGSYLSAHPTNEKKRRGRPPKFSDSRPSSPEEDENGNGSQLLLRLNKSQLNNDGHDDICAVCKQSGELLMCDTCSLVYHLGCLDPPLTSIPAGIWMCPKCQAGKEGQWPGTLAVVHSYIAHKTQREEEKKRLVKRQSELKSERSQLEKKAQQLKEKIMHEMKMKGQLLENNKQTQSALDKLKNFLKLFQVTPS
ncbi:PHD finger protein 21A-like [Glandiceps talaboti]